MGRLERLPDPETQARLWAAFVAAYSATKTRGGVDGFLTALFGTKGNGGGETA